MKIQQTKVNFVRLPLEEPLVGAPYMPGMLREFFTVQLQTDEGIEGIGITGFGGKMVRALDAALEDLGELIKGDDPLRTEAIIDKVPAYASGALTRTTPTDKLERAAAALVEKGYKQIKTQMAVDGLTPNQEIERIRLIRDAVGPDVNLMVDINQRWSVAEAISIGHHVEGLGLGWLEDPTTCDDYLGLA